MPISKAQKRSYDEHKETLDLFERIVWDIEDWLRVAKAHLMSGDLIEAQKDVACADNAMHDLFEKL